MKERILGVFTFKMSVVPDQSFTHGHFYVLKSGRTVVAELNYSVEKHTLLGTVAQWQLSGGPVEAQVSDQT